MTKRNSELESGRSMTEMLGVLAILGVLSVTSVLGFRYLSNKRIANDIVAATNERAVFIQVSPKDDLDLSEFHPNSEQDLILDRFPVSPVAEYTNSSIDLQDAMALDVEGIPLEICEILDEMQFPSDIVVLLNDKSVQEEDRCEEGNNNVMTYVFNQDSFMRVKPDDSSGSSSDPSDSLNPSDPSGSIGGLSNPEEPGEVVRRSCRIGASYISHDQNYEDCGKCDDGVIVYREIELDPCHKCGSVTNFRIENNDGAKIDEKYVCSMGKPTCVEGYVEQSNDPGVCVECNTGTDCVNKAAGQAVCNIYTHDCITPNECQDPLVYDETTQKCQCPAGLVLSLTDPSKCVPCLENFRNQGWGVVSDRIKGIDSCNSLCGPNQYATYSGSYNGGFSDFLSGTNVTCTALAPEFTNADIDGLTDKALIDKFNLIGNISGNYAGQVTTKTAVLGENPTPAEIRSFLKKALANYYVPKSGTNWFNAQSWCRAKGGKLISFEAYKANNSYLQVALAFVENSNYHRHWTGKCGTNGGCGTNGCVATTWQCGNTDSVANALWFLCAKH